ncbi:MAG: hypothetical protein OHK0013_12040 [Sandaracinaceae bacterium]
MTQVPSHPVPDSTLPDDDLRTLDAAARRAVEGDDPAVLDTLVSRLPSALDARTARVADQLAFGLGRFHRYDDAIALLERAYAVAPTWRRASSLAWCFYSAALDEAGPGRGRGPRRGEDERRARRDREVGRDPSARREALRKGFRRWVGEALRHDPSSIKDLYRLGLFESQVENAHDRVALAAFERAIDAYRAMSEDERERRLDLRRFYLSALYAAARSALRLGDAHRAKAYAFEGVHAHRARPCLHGVHVFDMAGRACFALGELDEAERGFRLALDADGPPRRDHLFVRLAQVCGARKDFEGGCRWIERHIRPERRAPYAWRTLGDLRADAGQEEAALAAWHAALERDRHGRHLTLTRIGAIHEKHGRRKQAMRAYEDAVAFARRAYGKRHRPAEEGLARLGAAPKDAPAPTPAPTPAPSGTQEAA